MGYSDVRNADATMSTRLSQQTQGIRTPKRPMSGVLKLNSLGFSCLPESRPLSAQQAAEPHLGGGQRFFHSFSANGLFLVEKNSDPSPQMRDREDIVVRCCDVCLLRLGRNGAAVPGKTVVRRKRVRAFVEVVEVAPLAEAILTHKG